MGNGDQEEPEMEIRSASRQPFFSTQLDVALLLLSYLSTFPY